MMIILTSVSNRRRCSVEEMFLIQLFCFAYISVLQAKNKGEREIIFSNFKDIRQFKYGASNYTTLLGGLQNIRNIGYDYQRGYLFYESETMIIKRTSMKNLNATSVVVDATFENNLCGIAVDWVTQKLYFTDAETNHVEVCRYDGMYRRVLVSNGLDQPRGIALLPQRGYMFVTDWGDYAKIERFNMDGSGRTVIVKTAIKWPYSITVDMKTFLVFWGDASISKIEYMTTDGKNRKVIQLNKDDQPYYLTVFQNELFWSDAKSSIFSCSTDDPDDVKSIDKLGSKGFRPYGLEIYSADKQPQVKTACSVNNGGCSHLCLLNPTGYSCACPTGIASKEDNKTCEADMKQFLLIARKMDIRIMSLDADKNVDIILPIKGITQCVGIEYDVEMKKVYWADLGTESINRAFLNGSGFEKVITYDMKAPDHLAIDWIARNMYWTESELDRIEVARIDGASRKIIISERLQQPRGIVVDPADGKIYWTDWGNVSKIECADLDGENRKVLVDKNIVWPNGITLDYLNRKLYWVDANYNSIDSFDLHTGKMTRIYNEAPHPFGITVLGGYLYWTDWHRIVMKYHLEKRKAERILVGISDVMGIKGVNTEPAYGMNDCYYKKNNCSHLCFHKPKKGIICACPTRMELAFDGKTCKMPSGFLLYSVSEGIMKMSIDTYKGSYKLPLSNANTASLIDTFYGTGRIFWLDDSGPVTINRAFLNGSGFESIVQAGLTEVYGLAVDWMAQNIYWVHNKQARIEVARLGGQHRRVLVYNKDVVSLQLLLINPHISKMLWFQKDKSNMGGFSLWEANLDGKHQKKLVNNVNPVSCTIDYPTNTIYWIHSDVTTGMYSIESFDRSTRKRKTVQGNLPFSKGLLFFDNSLIYADHHSQTIQKIPVNGTGASAVLVENINWVLDIKAFHGSVQTGTNRCSFHNGGCEHLCIALSFSNHKCLCATHYTLNDDGKTCSEPTHFIIFSHGSALVRILFDENQPECTLPIKSNHDLIAIDFDVIRGYVYWLHAEKRAIMRDSQDGKQFAMFLLQHENGSSHAAVQPHDFSLDPFSNAIYWTDKNHNTINFLHLTSKKNGTVFRQDNLNEYYPRRIVVFPEIGRIFWSSIDVNKRVSMIISTTLAGTELNSLQRFKWLMTIPDMKLDYVEKRLYWLESGSKGIYSISIHGNDLKVYNSKYMHAPVSISISGKYLYWADNVSKYIYKTWKHNATNEGMKFRSMFSKLTDLLVVNKSRGNETHPCTTNNGGCSHMCSIDYEFSLSPSHAQPKALCSCPLKQTLVDGYKCVATNDCDKNEEIYCSSDSVCIKASLQCNYKDDCSDGSDENIVDCPYPRQPCGSPHFIPCGKTGCIDIKHRCDGRADCPSSEDERFCDDCGKGKFQCDHNSCFENTRICNGIKDCRDGFDEKDCKKVNITGIIKPIGQPKSRNLVGIISGIIICVIVIIFAFFLWCKLCNSKKNAAREHNHDHVWPLGQLTHNNTESMTSDDKTSHAKSSVSTYISAISQNTEPSYYDRNNVTGASSTSALSGYSHLPFNPPPSPMTQRALSTIAETNDPYGCATCEHCRSTIEEEPLSEMENDAPPPTLASTLLLEDVDMFVPVQQPPQSCWSINTSSNSCQSKHCRSHKPRRSNRRRDLPYMNNFGICQPNEQLISEMDPLESPWMYESQEMNSPYDNSSTFIDSNKRFLCLDPPPTPCTTYLSEDEVRPPSPAETELSVTFRLLNNGETHYAPPPSPTSQL